MMWTVLARTQHSWSTHYCTSHYRFNSARGEEAGWGQTKLAKATRPTTLPCSPGTWNQSEPLQCLRRLCSSEVAPELDPSKESQAARFWLSHQHGRWPSDHSLPLHNSITLASTFLIPMQSTSINYPDKTSLVSAKMDSRSASFKKKNRGKYNLQLDAILQCSIQTNNERCHWNPGSWSLAKNLTVFQHALLHLEMSCQDLPNSLPLGLEVVFESLLNFLDGHVGLSASEIHEFPYSPNTGTYYTWHWRNVEEQIKHLIYHIWYMYMYM